MSELHPTAPGPSGKPDAPTETTPATPSSRKRRLKEVTGLLERPAAWGAVVGYVQPVWDAAMNPAAALWDMHNVGLAQGAPRRARWRAG
jgi:hypothetical protein